MTVYIFGVVSSPSTCQLALIRCAFGNHIAFEEVADLDVDLAMARSQSLSQILLKSGFPFTKCLSAGRVIMAAMSSKSGGMIPHLELQGTVAGVRLVKSRCEDLSFLRT